jgi:hypothetical protein
VAGSTRLPKVKTVCGGDMRVIRPVTPSEVIACWDVPKKLGQLFETEDDRISLMKEMFVPLKTRQLALEDLRPFMVQFLKSDSEKATDRSKVPLVVKRGPSLKLATPEEERAMFQDKSNPPMNSSYEFID